MKTVEVEVEVKRNHESGMYTAYVGGCIIGDYTFKFQAKRAIQKYIKNNFSTKQTVYSAKVVVGG